MTNTTTLDHIALSEKYAAESFPFTKSTRRRLHLLLRRAAPVNSYPFSDEGLCSSSFELSRLQPPRAPSLFSDVLQREANRTKIDLFYGRSGYSHVRRWRLGQPPPLNPTKLAFYRPPQRTQPISDLVTTVRTPARVTTVSVDLLLPPVSTSSFFRAFSSTRF